MSGAQGVPSPAEPTRLAYSHGLEEAHQKDDKVSQNI